MTAISSNEKSWQVEPASGRGRSHGTSTKVAFDRWFRYPAGFASDYAELLIKRLEVQEGLVMDPFAGSGVTGTAARGAGLGFFGVETHPLVAELARLKLNPRATSEELRELGIALAKQAGKATKSRTPHVPDLVAASFEDSVLRSLLRLRDAIKDQASAPAGALAKWALLATLRDVASVKVGWPYQRPGISRRAPHSDPIERFKTRIGWMAEDIESLPTDLTRSPATLVQGDSRDPDNWTGVLGTASVSSPPYLNNFDYADATRLELYFWGDIDSWSAMTRTVRSGMLTATTQQSSRGEEKEALAVVDRFNEPVRTELLGLHTSIGKAISDRAKRSKEYDRVLPAYFAAMSTILENVFNHSAPGAKNAWLIGDSAPYGIYVDTPALIQKLAIAVGFSPEADVKLRERGARWSSANRHSHRLSERLIVFRKP
jgi:hypothetical protein